jgi:hypothetical protein
MFSSITIALSSSTPMPNAIPPSDMTFSVSPPRPIAMNVAMTASGIERPTMIVLRSDRRNSSTTSEARKAPMSAASFTELIESRMNPD